MQKYRLPNLFFKFKALHSVESMVRVYDIIENNRLYLPQIPLLNDPFEGSSVKINYKQDEATRLWFDDENPLISELKKETRILSFTEDCFSPPLWAHYSNNYNGICFCYRTDGSFRKARKVEYLEPRKFDAISEAEIMKSMDVEDYTELLWDERIYQKQIDWAYEKEWRIVIREDDPDGVKSNSIRDEFIYYDESELVAIILGHKISKEVRDFIKLSVKNRFPLFWTREGFQSEQINLVPESYIKNDPDEEIKYIRRVKELREVAEEQHDRMVLKRMNL